MSERLMSETLFGLAEKIVGVLDEAIAERDALRERVAELEHGIHKHVATHEKWFDQKDGEQAIREAEYALWRLVEKDVCAACRKGD